MTEVLMKMGKHTLLMMGGCVVMLVGLFLLPRLGVRLGGVLPFLFALACPVSMVLMMGVMGKGHDHSQRGSGTTGENAGASCHEETAPRALPAPRDRS
jgi:hypothetical protein